MRKIVAIPLVLLIASPVALTAGFWLYNKAIGPVGWAMADTEKDLRTHMKDPDSMVIRSSFVVEKPGSESDTDINICGVVDSRNSFGAFTGGQLFASHNYYSKELGVYDHISVNIVDPEEQSMAHKAGMLSGFEKVYWNDFCVDQEHPPIAPPTPSPTDPG